MSITQTVDEMLLSIECAILSKDFVLLNSMLFDWKWLDIINDYITIKQYKQLLNVITVLPSNQCNELFKLFDKSFTNIKHLMSIEMYERHFTLPISKYCSNNCITQSKLF